MSRRVPWLAVGAVVLAGVLVACALLAGVLSPEDPNVTSLLRRLRPPVWAGGEWTNPLGTDQLGRDIASRALYGARVSLLIGLASNLFAMAAGVAVGILAGFYGGWFDQIAMFAVDVQLSMPFVLLAIAVSLVLGTTLPVLLLLAALALTPLYARLARGVALATSRQEFVAASRAMGASDLRLMASHVLPGLAMPLLVLGTIGIGGVIMLESSLSFLGIGVKPPTPSWGNMIGEGREYLASAWWIAGVPAGLLLLLTLSIGILGDYLRDRLDVHIR